MVRAHLLSVHFGHALLQFSPPADRQALSHLENQKALPCALLFPLMYTGLLLRMRLAKERQRTNVVVIVSSEAVQGGERRWETGKSGALGS